GGIVGAGRLDGHKQPAGQQRRHGEDQQRFDELHFSPRSEIDIRVDQRLNRNSFEVSTAQNRSSSTSRRGDPSFAASAIRRLNFFISSAFGSRLRAVR